MNKRELKILLGLLVLDVVILGLWINDIDPDPSVSIATLIYVPFLFILNLLIAAGAYFLKKRVFITPFLINSIISSVVWVILFDEGIDRHQNRRLESWEFVKVDTTFHITRWKKENEFSMSYSTISGSSTGFLDGKCILKKGEYVLTTDSTKYIIKNNYLIGFRTVGDTIRLTKLER